MKGDMQRIRDYYGVPAKLGGRVVYSGGAGGEKIEGTITGASGTYLRIRLDGSKFSQNYHPTWELEYLPGGAK